MKLIIAEKSSLAKKIAQALGVPQSSMQNNEFKILPCRGHLYQLKDATDYPENSKAKGWAELTLPIIPENFQKKGNKLGAKHLKAIREELKSDRYDEIIHWCDGDREGQLIGDEIFKINRPKVKVTRAWHISEGQDELKRAYAERRPNSDYSKISQAAQAREEIDWLIGINATVICTLKSGAFLALGRIMTPILQYIYDRDMEIENFVPEPYWSLSNKLNVPLTFSKKFNTEEEAQKKAKELNSNIAEVVSVEKKDVEKYPKSLFSLTTLKNYMNTKFGWKGSRTDEVAEAVYMKDLISYPRAETEYLKEDDKKFVTDMLSKINDSRLEFNPRIINEKKIPQGTAHTALILMNRLAGKDELDGDEKVLYDVIRNRYYANLCREKRIIAQTVMKIMVGSDEFKLKGEVEKEKGWAIFEEDILKNNLPNLNKGDKFKVNFESEKKMTTPPSHVSETELNNWLKNPFKKQEIEGIENLNEDVSDEDVSVQGKGLTIGTDATRGPAIEKLQKIGYITTEKKKFVSTPLGRDVIKVKDLLGIKVNKEETIEMESWIKEIMLGRKTKDEIMEIIKKRAAEIIKTGNSTHIEKVFSGKPKSAAKAVGKYKGEDVFKRKTKSGNVYLTASNSFILFEKTKVYGTEVKISEKDVKALIEGNPVKMKLYSQKKQKEYEAKVLLCGVNEKGYAELKPDFAIKK